MSRIYNSKKNVGSLNAGGSLPLDIRTVVKDVNDLLDYNLFQDIYIGLVVYVIETSSLYVCISTDEYDEDEDITLEGSWKKVLYNDDATSTTSVITSFDDLTNGNIESPKVGTIVYVNNPDDESKNGLYILTGEDSSVESNWNQIQGGTSDNIISVKPTDKTLNDYISSENPIESGGYYTSNGLNTFDDEGESKYDEVTITNDKGSSVTFYKTTKEEDGSWSGSWIKIDVAEGDDSFGDIIVKDSEGNETPYVNGEELPVGSQIKFGNDVDFTGFVDSNGNEFGSEESITYEDIDIYKESKIVDVIIDNNGEPTKILTNYDKIDLEDKISSIDSKLDNISETLMIDPDGDGSDEENTLQNVIINMNNAINKLEEIDIESITDEEISKLFNS